MNIDVTKRLEILEKRISKLDERIERQKVGPEVDTAKKIVSRLKAQYEKLQKDNGVFIPEATSSANSSFTEEELIDRLGAIYWIFGPWYEETFSFKNYRIEFLQILPNNYAPECVIKVQVHIYEDDKPLIMERAAIELWKGWGDSAEVDDINIAFNDRDFPYPNLHWFGKIAYQLAKTWNEYFRQVPLLEAKKSGYLESKVTGYLEV